MSNGTSESLLPTIPGQLVQNPYLSELQRHTSSLFGLDVSGHREPRFPGAQPISFNKSHLEELESENYFVSEKADGIRCLMLTHKNPKTHRNETFLIDRKNAYYFLDFSLPQPDDINSWQVDTVLDGELVLDIEKGQRKLWFLLFDCVILQGERLIEKPYTKRLGRLNEFVLKPYKQLYRESSSYARKLPFKLDVKPLELAYHVSRVFDQIPNLKHKNDGVIFTSSVAPYSIGTCNKMLKWKPSEENTVDFKVDGPDIDGRFYIMLNRGSNAGNGGHVRFDEFTLAEDMYQEWIAMPPTGRIIECKYDPDWPGKWKFSRYRDDKDMANHETVYHKIMDSIRDNVNQSELIAHESAVRDHWKEREMQQQYLH
ncbi:Dcp1p-Dcp2p decapping enzyme complex alpha subunit [Physocladia obscura]|uniref:mRNA guanylyltransferase n=1 Tax=Physocladia obscura TaxID=109957 RepID=A0AAD5XI95_9FUNG|nr:Dcp1p-Dcp2p decapping enzyme complex alpha subunit [Physocladia obscura]